MSENENSPEETEGENGLEEKDQTPRQPDPEEIPEKPDAPAAIDPTAVITTVTGKKYGWQNEPVRIIPNPQACAHVGTIAARAELIVHDIGHEWVCACGQIFEVVINTGGKKTLKEKVSE